MASYMVIVYADLIRKGKKTIEQVPEKLRAEVEAVLNKMKDHAACSDRHEGPEYPLRPVQYESSLAVCQLCKNFVHSILK